MDKVFKDLLIKGEAIVTQEELDEYLRASYEEVVKKTKGDIERYNKMILKSRGSSTIGPQLLYELGKNKK